MVTAARSAALIMLIHDGTVTVAALIVLISGALIGFAFWEITRNRGMDTRSRA